MNKVKEILIGTNNDGKYKEICNLLPRGIKKYSPKDFGILSPEEVGKTFEQNSLIIINQLINRFKSVLKNKPVSSPEI